VAVAPSLTRYRGRMIASSRVCRSRPRRGTQGGIR
jgi:hypothetical protein